ncbi:helix-turn-helix transcriptional regulator [Streptomyces bauhiniae]|uniref:helix-turn-helix transcriptional regulator n=1 Tax=Streptomyces bauhiniae TaxID=2340725 RepID=UPI00331C064B
MPDEEPEWTVLRRHAIGERIRTVRRHRRLTQSQLAEMLGVERRSIHRWETAKRDPALSVLVRLADKLDVPLALLVDDTLEIDLTAAHRDQRPERPSWPKGKR